MIGKSFEASTVEFQSTAGWGFSLQIRHMGYQALRPQRVFRCNPR